MAFKQWLKNLFDYRAPEDETFNEEEQKNPSEVICKTIALRMDPGQMRIMHLFADGSLLVDNRISLKSTGDTIATTLRFSKDELVELISFVTPDKIDADYTCTRCGATTTECKKHGCAKAPCPMASTEAAWSKPQPPPAYNA